MVKAPGCGPGDCGFKSHRPPFLVAEEYVRTSIPRHRAWSPSGNSSATSAAPPGDYSGREDVVWDGRSRGRAIQTPGR